MEDIYQERKTISSALLWCRSRIPSSEAAWKTKRHGQKTPTTIWINFSSHISVVILHPPPVSDQLIKTPDLPHSFHRTYFCSWKSWNDLCWRSYDNFASSRAEGAHESEAAALRRAAVSFLWKGSSFSVVMETLWRLSAGLCSPTGTADCALSCSWCLNKMFAILRAGNRVTENELNTHTHIYRQTSGCVFSLNKIHLSTRYSTFWKPRHTLTNKTKGKTKTQKRSVIRRRTKTGPYDQKG